MAVLPGWTRSPALHTALNITWRAAVAQPPPGEPSSLTMPPPRSLLLQRATNVHGNERAQPVTERHSPPAPRQGGQPASQRERVRRERQSLDLGGLEQHLGYCVRRLQVWVFQDFVRTLASLDIRPAQYSVLVVIAANSGLSQADLAERLGIEPARLVRLLDGLERRGLIRRRASRCDRRSHALVLTRDDRELKRM